MLNVERAPLRLPAEFFSAPWAVKKARVNGRSQIGHRSETCATIFSQLLNSGR